MSNSKRVAQSPLSDAGDEKRACVNEDSSFSDPDATILTSEESSQAEAGGESLLKSSLGGSSPPILDTVVEAMKVVLMDKNVLKMIALAVAEQMKEENESLRKEVISLKEEVVHKGLEIRTLRDRIDELEQYSRRNCLRISNVPEKAGEDTDQLVCAVASAAGLSLSVDCIDRSHRIGRVTGSSSGAASSGKKAPRQIIVKMVSYRQRDLLMKARKNLSSADLKKTFPWLDWSSVPVPTSSGSRSRPSPRIYINEDLTQERAKIAAAARELKRAKRVSDTWTKDGVIFIKQSDNSPVTRLTTFPQLTSFELENLCRS
jgi:hypothetical protein